MALVLVFVLVVGAFVVVVASPPIPGPRDATGPRDGDTRRDPPARDRVVDGLPATGLTAEDDDAADDAADVDVDDQVSVNSPHTVTGTGDPPTIHDDDAGEPTTVAITAESDIDLLRLLLENTRDGSGDRTPLRLENRIYTLDEPLRISWRHNIAIVGGDRTELVAAHGDDVVVVNGGDRVRLESVAIRHLDKPCIGACLKVIATRGFVAKDLALNGCGAIGLDAEHCENLAIESCRLFNNSWLGLRLTDCDRVALRANQLSDNYRTANIERVTGLTSTNNLNDGEPWSP